MCKHRFSLIPGRTLKIRPACQQDVIFTVRLGGTPRLGGLCFNPAWVTYVYFARPASTSAGQTLSPYKSAKNNRHRVLGRPTLRYAVGAAGLVLRRRFCTPCSNCLKLRVKRIYSQYRYQKRRRFSNQQNGNKAPLFRRG